MLFFLMLCVCDLNADSVASRSLGGPESVAQSREQPWVGIKGMAVSDDREASEWGAHLLRKGGNAIDAAVGVAFVLSVTRPHYASLGGGGFLLFCPKRKPCELIDFREKAPLSAQKNTYVQAGKVEKLLSRDGATSVGVPGLPAGLLMALHHYGHLPLKTILSKPIELAERGISFSPHSEVAAIDRWSIMNDEAKKLFGCKTKEGLIPCPPGTHMVQKDLSKVLKALRDRDAKGFYEGKIAESIVKGIQNAGGYLTLKDLKEYHPQIREPLRGTFNGLEVVTSPLPSSGGILLLQLLGYFERAHAGNLFQRGYAAAESLHPMIHAMSLAFSDRSQHLGDPDFVKVPVQTLLSSEYLDGKWKSFQSKQMSLAPGASDESPSEPHHTTHLSVIDKDGNAVAMTVTVNDNFGSGFVPPGTGLVMNDEMDDFSISPGHPNLFGLTGNDANEIAPGKRPLSSMTPAILRDQKGDTLLAIGAAGGPRIATSVFQTIVNHLHFKMSLPDAVDAPRIHHQWRPDKVYVERFGFSKDTRELLEKKGYTLQEVTSLGKIHAIGVLENQRLIGVPDPRGEGAAEAE